VEVDRQAIYKVRDEAAQNKREKERKRPEEQRVRTAENHSKSRRQIAPRQRAKNSKNGTIMPHHLPKSSSTLET